MALAGPSIHVAWSSALAVASPNNLVANLESVGERIHREEATQATHTKLNFQCQYVGLLLDSGHPTIRNVSRLLDCKQQSII